MLKKVAYRFYSDFLLPNRLDEWRHLLQQALESGYEVCSVASFWRRVRSEGIKPGSKYLVVRHDVDTDVSTARRMWEIEKQLNVRTSYYFRLSTLDVALMREIEFEGGEASYHYEELATYAKRAGLASREAVLASLDIIRATFAQNLNVLRAKTGISMEVVASHGDWINRKLRLPNWVILEDRAFRREVGVELEVYDNEFMRFVTSRHSDAPYPTLWKPRSPVDAVRAKEHVVYVLVHPRHWRANPYVNLVSDVSRLWEGAVFYLRVLGRAE